MHLRRLWIALGLFAAFANTSAAALVGLTPAEVQATVVKGDPGGNSMAIGLFGAISAINIPIGTDLVQTSGWSITGVGAARYALDSDQTTPTSSATRQKSLNRRWFKLCEEAPAPEMFGAAGDHVANDRLALQAAIDACPNGGAITLNGAYRCSDTTGLTIAANQRITIRGQDPRNTNIVDFNSRSMLYFDQNATNGITLGAGAGLKLVDLIVAGPDVNTSTATAIKGNSGGGDVICENVTFQNWQRSGDYTLFNYSFFKNCYDQYCLYGMLFTECHDVTLVNHKSNAKLAGSDCLILNSSHARIFGGALEGFRGQAISLSGASSAIVDGTYFEGDAANPDGTCIFVSDNGSVIAQGCEVYMDGCSKWIQVEGSGTANYSIVSKGNIFHPVETTRRVDYYTFATTATGYVDVEGDSFFAPDGPPGANNNYLNPDYSFVPTTAGVGSYRLKYPVGSANFGRDINTLFDCIDGAASTPASPKPLTLTGFLAADAASDPLGIRTSAWGANPYRAVFQNGGWEKVGFRIANIADVPTGGSATAAANATAINALFAALRADGVMI